MLTNAKVGTKLLALVIAPVMVLLAVASLGARDRLDEASRAERVEEAASLTALTDEAVRRLGDERLVTASAIAGGSDDGLAEARASTDAALEAFEPVLASFGLAGSGDRVEQAEQRLAELSAVRDGVDAGDVDAIVAIDAYSLAIDELIRFSAELAASTSAAELSLALSNASVLTRAIEARSTLAALAAVDIGAGEFAGGSLEQFIDLRDEQDRLLARFTDGAVPAYATQLRDALATPEAVAADAQLDDLISDATLGGQGEPGVSMAAWVDGQRGWLEAVGAVDADLVADVTRAAAAQEASATRAARLFMMATAAGTLLSILLAVWLARSIDRPLRRLTVAADELATDRLPRLVENLRSADGEVADLEAFEPLEVTAGDEIGQMTEAFNAIQQVTVNVAEEQSTLLRKGIGDIFVNLARRNQSLLDRQIEFIDELESKEQDPDLLENLFRLDHLATRMRRNAESLLVLAGAEPARRRARPVALADVVRVAIGEVEDFTRVELLEVDDAVVAGNLAVDLSHLLSELMENATHFSPPETSVEVAGQFGPEGDYVITVADHGIGMSADDLSEANALLSDPPLVGLALGRSLGFIVVGRLAVRLGLRVHLNASPAGGVTAVIALPGDLVSRPDEAEPRDPLLDRTEVASPVPEVGVEVPGAPDPGVIETAEPEGLAPTPLPEPEGLAPTPLPEPEGLAPTPLPEPDPVLPARGGPADHADRLAEALPQGDDFEDGLATLIEPEPGDQDVEHQFRPPLAEEDESWGEDAAMPFQRPPSPVPPPAPPPAPGHDLQEEPVAGSVERPEPPPPPPEPPAPLTEPAGSERPVPAAPTGSTEFTVASIGRESPEPGGQGLIRRVPGAAAGPEAITTPSVGAPRRSPEQVRAMLSRYREGLKGRPGAPRPGAEGSTTEESDD